MLVNIQQQKKHKKRNKCTHAKGAIHNYTVLSYMCIEKMIICVFIASSISVHEIKRYT